MYSRVSQAPHAIWLDSAAPHPPAGRYSFVAWQPFAVLRSWDGTTEWTDAAGVRHVSGSVVEELDDALIRWQIDSSGVPLPFCGGCAGFLGYELGGGFEEVPRSHKRDHELPDCELAFYDVVVGWDHESGACFVVSTGHPDEGEAGSLKARSRLTETLEVIAGIRPPGISILPDSRLEISSQSTPEGLSLPGQTWLKSTASEEEYRTIVQRAIEYIAQGDVYQVNLSQRFAATIDRTPLELYLDLRQRNAAPYAAVLRSSGPWILSSSPERFLRIDTEGRIEARPIKGTRPRGADPSDDEKLASELQASEKDRAENLMIVDLLRNDLSRVCLPGSVRVPELFGLESWSTVHHLVSTITGQLRPGTTVGEVIRATFPSGSITGAPKIRAMEIIAELEPIERGPYCGAIGYFSFDGEVDLSVAIRVLCVSDTGATYHAGGGVVYDSVPGDEYLETLDKAKAITAAVAGNRRVGADR